MMLNYLLKRLTASIPVFLGIITLVFFIMHLMPGDPASIMLGFALTEERAKALREELGLNYPLYVQYGRHLANIARGDFGRSMSKSAPVATLIRQQMPATVQLAVAGLGCALAIGIILGIVSATHHQTWIDTVAMVLALSGVSMPEFWFGLLLILAFAVHLQWVPIIGTGGLGRLILPAVALGFYSAGMVARLVRSSMLEVLNQDYVRTARAKGQRELLVLYRHALKNAMIPVVTIVGLQFGRLLAGSVIIETVFGREGIGRLLVEAILVHDIPLVQGIVLVTAVGYVIANLLVDFSYALLDPRVSYR